MSQADAQKESYRAWLAWSTIAADFQGLQDVAPAVARASALQNRKEETLKKDRSDDARETQSRSQLPDLVEGPRGEDAANRPLRLGLLKGRWSRLARDANAAEDSDTRRMARRLLAGAAVRTFPDPDVQTIFAPYRRANPFQ